MLLNIALTDFGGTPDGYLGAVFKYLKIGKEIE